MRHRAYRLYRPVIRVGASDGWYKRAPPLRISLVYGASAWWRQ